MTLSTSTRDATDLRSPLLAGQQAPRSQRLRRDLERHSRPSVPRAGLPGRGPHLAPDPARRARGGRGALRARRDPAEGARRGPRPLLSGASAC
ncbi:hypothetical protein ABTD90_19255, partial [Acinetobacter baumannii]